MNIGLNKILMSNLILKIQIQKSRKLKINYNNLKIIKIKELIKKIEII